MSRQGKSSSFGLQDNVEDPVELESHFILRLPSDAAESLSSLLNDGMLVDELQINLDSDMRSGKVKFGNREMHASLDDLPCIVETLKTTDKKTFYKAADVAQLLVCREGPAEPPADSEECSDPKKREKQHQWPHGITPPLKNVRKRRFRKTLRKKYMDAPELEKELKRLLRADIEAASIKWEIVSIQEEVKQKANMNEALDQSEETKGDVPLYAEETELITINEDDLFGEALSSSSSDLEDECSTRDGDIVQSLDLEDSNSIDIDAVRNRVLQLQTDLMECVKRKEHMENELSMIQNLSLRERLNEEVQILAGKMAELERELKSERALLPKRVFSQLILTVSSREISASDSSSSA
uniref:TAFII55_N domain-containing protein n=1 Tax=Trichuris muris TaxID=70415 RepID=A0A5S6QIB7_TRIMR